MNIIKTNAKKNSKIMAVLKRARSFVPRNTLQNVYNAFVDCTSIIAHSPGPVKEFVCMYFIQHRLSKLFLGKMIIAVNMAFVPKYVLNQTHKLHCWQDSQSWTIKATVFLNCLYGTERLLLGVVTRKWNWYKFHIL